MRLSDFDYPLPDELVARYPAGERRASRLLVLDRHTESHEDRRFSGLPALLRPGDVLVFNDTRVIKARLRGKKASGGRVEVLIERPLSDKGALAQLRASKAPKPGSQLKLPGGQTATVSGRDDEFFVLEFAMPLMPYLEAYGEVPLPPYLNRDAEADDLERYQTVYARHDGAVAAPTAGLHFDEEMLDEIGRAGVAKGFVTLHVGAGTFQPLRDAQVESNRIHREHVVVDEPICRRVNATRRAGGRVIAVGTTSVRALESAWRHGELKPFEGETDLFIFPGYEFRVVDAMITNFHLPRSSLLMLVTAFAGTEFVLDAYRHAVNERYRFYSYGDAMFIS
jgi:S-adenosylmethionine:tRNA ribosyltransferase-isomerase